MKSNSLDFSSLASFIEGLTEVSKELFQDKVQHQKHYTHLNHMQGRISIWTHLDYSTGDRSQLYEYTHKRNEGTDDPQQQQAIKDTQKAKADEMEKSNALKAEFWHVTRFLPLRIQAYILEFIEANKEDFQSPHPIINKDAYKNCIINQIASDIETLKNYNIYLVIRDKVGLNPGERNTLFSELDRRVSEAVTKNIFSNGYLVASGCRGHCLYVSLKINGSDVIGTIFEGGLFMEHHDPASTDVSNLLQVYPYTFKRESSALLEVIRNLREALSQPKEPKEEVRKRIYGNGVKVGFDQLQDSDRFSYTVLTVSNCVLANHNISMIRHFGFHGIVDQIIKKEKQLAAGGLSYDNVATFWTHREEELKKADDLYQEALKLEEGPPNGSPQWEKAFQSYQQAHEMGLRSATAKLGFFCYYGLGTSPDVPRGLALLKSSAEEGDSFGQAMFGLACMLGIRMGPDIEAARHWFRSSINSGGSGALYARSLLPGIDQVIQTPEEKAKVHADLQKAADNGDVYANHLLIWAKDDPNERIKRSAQWGFPDGRMKYSYDQGNIESLKKLLSEGRDFAAFLLGLVHLEKEELLQATGYFEHAAQAGIAQSYAYLADKYFKKGDQNKAVNHLRMGAERGMGDAMYGLGLAYLKGMAGEDSNYGYVLLREAAERGSFHAKQELANRYDDGHECVRDTVQAKKYRGPVQSLSIPVKDYPLFKAFTYQRKTEVSNHSQGAQGNSGFSHSQTEGATGTSGLRDSGLSKANHNSKSSSGAQGIATTKEKGAEGPPSQDPHRHSYPHTTGPTGAPGPRDQVTTEVREGPVGPNGYPGGSPGTEGITGGPPPN
ncbi:MAG: SEL1-like repeat protein [Chlamydiia bacterium]|nr:SEL1-like repeat protein [Chlamydiia bacterium]